MLRPLCLVALCLAALTSVFGQQPKPTERPRFSPRPLPTRVPPDRPARRPSPPKHDNNDHDYGGSARRRSARHRPRLQTNPRSPPPSIPGTTPVPSDKTETLQFPNSDVVDVLRFYEKHHRQEADHGQLRPGQSQHLPQPPVPREEAIKIIEMNLLMNGYSLVPAGDDIVKVIGTGRSPRNAGVPLISDEADIPEGEHVISFLFKLRYADPMELQQVLGQYLSPPQSYTSFLALPKSSSILITENSSVIRSLIHIVDQIDVPPAQVVSEFIKLQRADASKVVEMLKEVFDKGGATTTTAHRRSPGCGRCVRRTRARRRRSDQVNSGRRPERVHRALGRFDRRRQDQDRRRRADEPDSRHHPPGEHAVHKKADLRSSMPTSNSASRSRARCVTSAPRKSCR